MNDYNQFLLGGFAVAIIVLVAWLSSNLMRAERVLIEMDKETKEVRDRRLLECATYPYLNTWMGVGYGHPFWLMRTRPTPYPYFVTV